jgi:hypothetical protein
MDYAKAEKKFDGLAWYDPTEAERKAVVAKTRKGRDLAYAPTGTSLEAGRMVKVAELEGMMSKPAVPATVPATAIAAATPAPAAVAAPATAAPAQPAATAVAEASPANVPVPQQNPLAFAPEPPQETADASKKPFWKFWSKN